MIDSNSLFGQLVQYYYHDKWNKCKNDVKDGIFDNRYESDFAVGDENPFHGTLILANSDTLGGKLIEAVLVKKEGLGDFTPIKTIDDFIAFMDKHKKRDRAIIYDGVNTKMTSVEAIYANRLAHLGLDLDRELPPDFMTYDVSVPVSECGARTRTAMLIAKAYTDSQSNVDTYMIKTTAYTPLGLGLVAHFTRDGLKETFFLKHDLNARQDQYIDREHSVIGIHRTYRHQDRKIVLESERVINPSEIVSLN